MTYKMKRNNVIKIVDSKEKRDALVDQGFKEVEVTEAPEKKSEKKKGGKEKSSKESGDQSD